MRKQVAIGLAVFLFQLVSHRAVASGKYLDSQTETAEGLQEIWFFTGFNLTQRDDHKAFFFEFVNDVTGEQFDPVAIGLAPEESASISEELDSKDPVQARLVRVYKQGKIIRQELRVWVHSVKKDIRVVNADEFNNLLLYRPSVSPNPKKSK